jgi:hypothetical protein
LPGCLLDDTPGDVVEIQAAPLVLRSPSSSSSAMRLRVAGADPEHEMCHPSIHAARQPWSPFNSMAKCRVPTAQISRSYTLELTCLDRG